MSLWNFDEMMERINELYSQRNISELKKYINEINPADIAQLLENVLMSGSVYFFSVF